MMKTSKAINKLALISLLGVAIGTTFSLASQYGLEALAQGSAAPTESLSPKAGDADRLRTSPGEYLVPTIANPFTFKDSNRTFPAASVTRIDFGIEAIPPVTPYIPNASPVSPARNSPGALTTDPVRAFPLMDSNYSESKNN
jgi:hypothetical protein